MILGLNFSKRKNGNCGKSIEYAMEYLKDLGHQTEIISINEMNIRSCCDFDYYCFKNSSCGSKDDFGELNNLIKKAKKVVSIVPIYRGHLASSYFKLSERLEGAYRLDKESFRIENLEKMNFIIIGNKNAGVEMGLQEALYDFSYIDYNPELLIASSRQYGLKSIEGNMIENKFYRQEVQNFIDRVIG